MVSGNEGENMAQRLTQKLTDVAREVEQQIRAHYNITQKELTAWQSRARNLRQTFPKSTMVEISTLWIDYEVQRDVLHKHVINIMKKWDPQICSPVSACTHPDDDKVYTYDGQHRTVAATILGFESIPCAVVETTDKNFASYAFEMLNDTGVKRLNPGDLHRNALVRYKNGSRDIKNVRARTMQDQFDNNEIDLQDKGSRASDNLRGDHDYFFSHFKYAQKVIELDESGRVLNQILSAIKQVYPLQEEIDQGVFIGLFELRRLIGTNIFYNGVYELPDDWMVILLESCKKTFKSSHLLHAKAKVQWEHSHPGAGWVAPTAMSNFMRELHLRNGGTLELPYHGDGARVGIEEGNVAPGLFPQENE
jgi:hypothetical protein